MAVFASCKGTHTCSCNIILPDGQKTHSDVVIKKITKKDAEKICTTVEIGFINAVEGTRATCLLK